MTDVDPATLRTFTAPFCYLPPQKRANHASGNTPDLASHIVRLLGKVRYPLKTLSRRAIERSMNSRQTKLVF
ncbi:hypothetical protein ALP66_102548 [Pseudomonas amygdali pv. photiniae]|uniref:Uncharacterized protein n=5 Tax=Pseudomonas syringae group genomosp. 2 TaxID=251698 RepID=A0A3M5ZNK8_PSESS|nr:MULTISPECIES: hypothetical protein [Pseudomonas syringae group genomosp. 2]KPW72461.1 hypothetical protein ALO78_101975 [Pseudomonas amygdali pv. ciccaronei]KPX11336.1 hypothetical protein ALO74_102226 [Pseudomonas syringae pv. cunninghamiae]KPX74038.1 hypothetical protein ALO53_102364 [Pseudomonas amygdali pv. photiniae]KPX86148.1 hypothetical protein ALO64_100534 [Pseudomonas meliae]KPX98074.1 hypothetical protein ALO61_102103 [Pseudomonas savastanoi pv. nerii]KPX99500.1 hypothetical pro